MAPSDSSSFTNHLAAKLTTSPAVLLSISTAVLFAIYVLIRPYLRRLPPNAPKVVSGDYPITGALGFWRARWDFSRTAARQSPTGNYTFHVGPHTVVGVSGARGRKFFFENKGLGFSEGYAVLFGQSPQEPGKGLAAVDSDDVSRTAFGPRLGYLLKNSEFRRKLTILISDVEEAIENLKNDPSGVTDPFESIYRIVFKLTIRMVGADDIANDPQLSEQTLKYIETIEHSTTATAIMFPKIPSLPIFRRTYAGVKLYIMIRNIVKKRIASGEKHDDPLQYLMDRGDSMHNIIEFVLGSMFAGLLNSGINAAWVLCWLAKDDYWRGQVVEEIRTVAAKYSKTPSLSLYAQLADVPLEAWESEFPIIDICLRDSIRLNSVGTAFRKNITGEDIPIGNGEVVPAGAFVTYAMADMHLNPNTYPNPEKWDPSRYLPERAEDKRDLHGYLGWGVARHPCLGMRFAKLEQNLITAYFLATFECDLTYKNGTPLAQAPMVNFNDYSASKPERRPHLKYWLRQK